MLTRRSCAGHSAPVLQVHKSVEERENTINWFGNWLERGGGGYMEDSARSSLWVDSYYKISFQTQST